MSYIDGFVIAVPTANKQKFIEHARHFDTLFIELGAIRVIEGWATMSPTAKSPISVAQCQVDGRGPAVLKLAKAI